jgi:hypothetical protein
LTKWSIWPSASTHCMARQKFSAAAYFYNGMFAHEIGFWRTPRYGTPAGFPALDAA